jgi:hypothetical protein
VKPAAGLLAAALALPAAACPPEAADGRLVAAEGLQAAWKPADAAAIEVSRHFAVLIRLCPAEAELLAVDATMPAHRHGMNYRPSLKPLGGGRWRAEGLLFHMAGAWELRLDVRHAGRTVVLRQAIDLP